MLQHLMHLQLTLLCSASRYSTASMTICGKGGGESSVSELGVGMSAVVNEHALQAHSVGQSVGRVIR